jgi:hypothetical protein
MRKGDLQASRLRNRGRAVTVDKYDFRDFPISNVRLKSPAPDSGRICLDRRCRNVYK